MSEMREHMTLTLLNAWHWARDNKWNAGGDFNNYSKYVVCLEAQTVIEAELKRRDRRAYSRWIHGGVLDSCNPDKYFLPTLLNTLPEEAHHD
jgi:hypothetical protein